MRVDIKPNRIETNDSPRGVEIVITAKQNILSLFIYGIVIIIWGCIEVFVIYIALSTDSYTNAGIMILVAAVTVFGAYFIYSWLWQFTGKERIILTRDGLLIVKKDILGFGYNRKFYMKYMTGLRIAIYEFNPYSSFLYQRMEQNLSGGSIAFEHRGDTYHFAVGVDETEAQLILNELCKYHDFQAG